MKTKAKSKSRKKKMEASEQVVLQSVLDSQQRLEGAVAMLTDAFKRWCDLQISKGSSGNENSEHSTTMEVAHDSSPEEALPSAPVALPNAPAPGAQGDATTTFGNLAPNTPPDVAGTFSKRMPEKSTTN